MREGKCLKETYIKAIKTYGADMQQTVAIEEMSELIKELCKNKRGNANISHIAEEIADVQIMLEQLILIFDIKNVVDAYKIYKVDRLNKRLGSKKEGLKDDGKNEG